MTIRIKNLTDIEITFEWHQGLTNHSLSSIFVLVLMPSDGHIIGTTRALGTKLSEECESNTWEFFAQEVNVKYWLVLVTSRVPLKAYPY
ncbi:MAG: hypothetical protein ACYSWW_26215 [Planctomycetota bacterium]